VQQADEAVAMEAAQEASAIRSGNPAGLNASSKIRRKRNQPARRKRRKKRKAVAGLSQGVWAVGGYWSSRVRGARESIGS